MRGALFSKNLCLNGGWHRTEAFHAMLFTSKGGGDMKVKDFGGRFFRSVLFLALWALFSSGAQAGTIYVGKSEKHKTIQAGIDAAVDGDTVTVRDGTYSPPNADGIDFHGKAITLRSENGPANCIIDGVDRREGSIFTPVRVLLQRSTASPSRTATHHHPAAGFTATIDPPRPSPTAFSGAPRFTQAIP